MNSRIFKYYKTEHFLLRQWERGIQDELLLKVLRHSQEKPDHKLVLIIKSALLKYWFHQNIFIPRRALNMYLVIVLHHNLLVTGFFCRNIHKVFSNYQFEEFKYLE